MDDDGKPVDAELRDTAKSVWRDVMRFDAPPISDPYTEFTTDHIFGRLWDRPGMARRDRRLVSLTTIALRGLREPLVAHINAALDSGDFTSDELHEWVLHLAHYGGWPIGANAYAVLREVLAHPSGQ